LLRWPSLQAQVAKHKNSATYTCPDWVRLTQTFYIEPVCAGNLYPMKM
jgi:hypothetical protein